MKRIFLIQIFLSATLFLSAQTSRHIFRSFAKSEFFSKRNLVSGAKYKWDGKSLLENRSGYSGTDTIRVLALRVSFTKDIDPLTTGNGTFDNSASDNPVIDPPPHNKRYFESQLEALKNYFYKVSNGKLVIIPRVSDEVIELPDSMSVYATAPTDTGLVRLFTDAISGGDKSGCIFSDFDVYVIFHAGVGRDVQLPYDPTPNDISSAFVSYDDLKRINSGSDADYKGVSVENGNFFVKEGIILPETESQEGYQIGLLGTSAIMFGFQIGMPALWDTKTQHSGIGRWGLMDQGSGNFSGLLPAEPCAWTKIFMGWEEPVLVNPDTTIEVAAPSVKDKNRIYKVPINDHEYFLIENRESDVNRDSVAVGKNDRGGIVVFNSNGTVGFTGENGVIVSADEYDFDLPGSGILIWHIDEDVIKDKIADNEINIDKNHRGVDLEEADGAQDIGEGYGLISGGAGSEYGVLHDAWYEDNKINKLVNKKDIVEFTPESYPSTDSYDRGNTHLIFNGFSKRDTVMQCTIRSDFLQKGFPVRFGNTYDPMGIIAADLNNDGRKEIFIPEKQGKVFCWNPDGSPASSNMVTIEQDKLNGEKEEIHVPCCIDYKKEFTSMPVVFPGHDSVPSLLIASTKDGSVTGWSSADEDKNGLFDEVFTLQTDDNVILLAVINNEIFAGTDNGTVYTLSRTGEIIKKVNFGDSPVAAVGKFGVTSVFILLRNGNLSFADKDLAVSDNYITGDNALSGAAFCPSNGTGGFVAVTGGSGIMTLSAKGEVKGSAERERVGPGLTAPALADMDGDGMTDLFITGGSNVWGMNENCAFTDYFPLSINDDNKFLSSPVIGDVDNDDRPDIVAATSGGIVEAWSFDGAEEKGFPLTTGSSKPFTPVLTDLDGDGDVELIALSDRGWVFAWDLDTAWNEKMFPWPEKFHDSSHTSNLTAEIKGVEPSDEIMVVKSVYNYPNPVEGKSTVIRYKLECSADVNIEIIDLNGNLIDRFAGPGNAFMNNEVVWNVENVSSGIYFCRVYAKSDKGEKRVTISIAVAK